MNPEKQKELQRHCLRSEGTTSLLIVEGGNPEEGKRNTGGDLRSVPTGCLSLAFAFQNEKGKKGPLHITFMENCSRDTIENLNMQRGMWKEFQRPIIFWCHEVTSIQIFRHAPDFNSCCQRINFNHETEPEI